MKATKNESSVVGDLINFRGMVYSPINESGVVFLFGKVVDDLQMYIEEIKPGYPDCIARRFIGKGWERIRIEFEFKSSNFLKHKHDPNGCDMIVCWEHDWKKCHLEVIELKKKINEFENYPIEKPDDIEVPETLGTVEGIFERVRPTDVVREWYTNLINAFDENRIKINLKIGTKYIGVYSRNRSFCSLRIRSQSIGVECFSRGEAFHEGTRVSHEKYAPRWAKFSIKSNENFSSAIKILIESEIRLKAAIEANENTGYYSGGEPMPSNSES